MIIRSVSILGIRRVVILIPLVTLALISCLDFQFESEYEDINGIYVEFLYSYDYYGTKLLFNGNTGYMINADSLLVFDFSRIDSVILLGHYTAAHSIYDFQIHDDYAILVTALSMEIVDLRDSLPNQLSILSAFSFASSIKVHNDNAYVVCTDDLHVVDIADKQQPVLISTFTLDDNIEQIEIDSNSAYVLTDTAFTILDIRNPSALAIVASTSLPLLSIFSPSSFCKKDTFVYIACFPGHPAWLAACALTESFDLEVQNHIVVPDRIRKFHMSDAYTLAISPFDTYLLNLQYPSSPCISEEIGVGGIHGTIHQNHVCILTPYLVIYEIKQVE